MIKATVYFKGLKEGIYKSEGQKEYEVWERDEQKVIEEALFDLISRGWKKVRITKITFSE